MTFITYKSKLPNAGLTLFFTHRCLLDRAYKSKLSKAGLTFFFTHRYLLDRAYKSKLSKAGLTLFLPECLLDRAYKSDGRKRVLLLSTYRCLLDRAYRSKLPKAGLTIFLPGLTLDCQLFSFSLFTHLDLPSAASASHSYLLTWTYPRVPVPKFFITYLDLH